MSKSNYKTTVNISVDLALTDIESNKLEEVKNALSSFAAWFVNYQMNTKEDKLFDQLEKVLIVGSDAELIIESTDSTIESIKEGTE